MKKNQKFGLLVGLLVIVAFGGIFAVQQSFNPYESHDISGSEDNQSESHENSNQESDSGITVSQGGKSKNTQESATSPSGSETSKRTICAECHGSGKLLYSEDVKCTVCGGKGYIPTKYGSITINKPCTACNYGYVTISKYGSCEICGGDGYTD